MSSEKKPSQSVRPGLSYPDHGGNREAAARQAGLRSEDLIDFSASINPLGPPNCVHSALRDSAQYLDEYPDPQAAALRTVLSERLGISPDRITAANGSTELIYLIPYLWSKNKEVALVTPCFSEYERAFRTAGVSVRNIPLDAENGFHFDPDPFLFQLQGLKNLGGVVIGNPNSPAGNLWKADSLSALVHFCEKRNLFLVIDETFIEFCGYEHSPLKQIDNNRHLILVRSMTKFYALPGLRLGYGIMHPGWIEKLESRRPPWSVNAIAQAVGKSVLGDTEFPDRVREFIRKERNFLYKGLKEIPALEVFSSDANFLLFRLREGTERESKALYSSLLGEGLLVRNCG
ncbi:MAG: threonine-phosphate decarboxylase, partial [Nitrospinaceae bacterium]